MRRSFRRASYVSVCAISKEPKDKYLGVPLSEWVAKLPNELPIDAVGLWQIIPTGQDSFGLAGTDLEEFTKRCIIGLIKAGAKSVVASRAQGIFWEHQPKYGTKPEDIAGNVIIEWRKNPSLDNHDELWFDLLDGNFKPCT